MSVRPTASDTLLQNKRIAIVGGGPSGLTLARLLQMRGASVRVYDADESMATRNQGGSLDLHEATGQLALKAAGLLDAFFAVSRPEGQETKVLDRFGKVYIDIGRKDEKSSRPEIDRGVLRELLCNALQPDTVQWGRHLQALARGTDGRLELRFAQGITEHADLVFGCDGTWSRVRPLVCETRPQYSGITFIEGRILNADDKHPAVSKLVGHGAIMVTGDNRAFICQRNDGGQIRLYACVREPEDWLAREGFDFKAPASVRAKLLAHYSGWAPAMLEILQVSEDYFVPRPIYTHLPIQTWQPQPDVTLTGDAAHVMPPYTGKGVNLAMLDALELADALTTGGHADIPCALRTYEKAMMQRMEKEITLVMQNQDVFISPVAPEGVVELFKQRMAAGD